MSKHISIVVPVYNANNSLHCCIDSILNQTYSDFELILVDDGSTDESGRICDTYAIKDNRVKVIHQDNSGVSVARNTGIKAARGDYICFVDSDDYINRDYLKKLLETKKKYSDFDNIWCGMRTVSGYDSETLQSVLFSNTDHYSVSSVKEIMTLHEKWLDAGPYCKLYSKKIIQNNKLRFDTNLSLGEDLTFNFRYLDLTNKKIVIVNEPLYSYFKQNEGTLSSKYYADLYSIYESINQTMFLFLKKWECDNSQLTKFYNSYFYCYENVFRNTFRVDSCIKQKYKYNRTIMKTSNFHFVLKNSDCFIHPFYRFAYKISSYRLVRLLDYLHNKRK